MKKVFSVFLSLVMLLSVTAGMRLSVVANDNGGYCGEDVTYMFYSKTGTLVISGTGDITSTFEYDEAIKKVIINDGVTGIGDRAFYDCTALTSIDIPDSVTGIGDRAFYGCTGLTSIDIPDGVTYISEGVFYGCTGLTSITIPNSVTTIDDYAFRGCTGLTSAVIGNGVTYIGDYAFCDCTGLNSVAIPDSVTGIGNYAFEGCTNVPIFIVPDSVTRIGSYAFYGCRAIVYSGTGSYGAADVYKKLKDGFAFIDTNMTLLGKYVGDDSDVTVPNGVKSIADNAFAGCTNLTGITIPASVTMIGDAFFGCTNLSRIIIDEHNASYDSRNNCNAVIETASDTLEIGCKGTTVPDGVTEIATRAFYYCTGLTSVKIPDSVTKIDEEAFGACYGLTSVVIGNGVTDIDTFAFYQCLRLKSLTFGNRVASIGKGAFYGCSALTGIQLPNSVRSIGDFAFSCCTGLTSVKIPDSVTSIGKWAFEFCRELKSVTMSKKVTAISYGAFSACYKLNSITVPKNVKSISTDAFCGCTGLKSIVLPKSTTLVEKYAFDECYNLKDVYYTGSQAEWERLLSIEYGNYLLYNATKHYGYVMPEDRIDLSKASVKGVTAKLYTGKAIKQSITVTLNNKTLKNNTDYKVTYKNNIKAGTATLTVTGIGKYKGSVNKTFTIFKAKKPATVKGVTSTITVNDRRRKVSYLAKWKKVKGAAGYQVQTGEIDPDLGIYWHSVKTIKGGSKTKYKQKIQYATDQTVDYVRVRAYRVVKGQKVYGKWSKTATTKWKWR